MQAIHQTTFDRAIRLSSFILSKGVHKSARVSNFWVFHMLSRWKELSYAMGGIKIISSSFYMFLNV